MLKKTYKFVCYATFTFLISEIAVAHESLSELSERIMVPVAGIEQLLYLICYIIGTALVLGGLMRFKHYRNSPTQTPLSHAVLILAFGIVLILIPLGLNYYHETAPPGYSHRKL